MMIVDAQVHIWAASTPERPWPARHEPHRAAPITADELLRENKIAGIHRTVLVPPSFEGDYNDVVLAAAQKWPDNFAAMGRLDPEAPDAAAQVARWKQQPGMYGMRFTFHRPSMRPLLAEGKMNAVWAAAEQAGVPIMLLAPHRDLHFIDAVAARHPGLKLIIDHLGLHGTKDAAGLVEFDKLLVLGKRPNVAVKVSCLPQFTTDTYPFKFWHPYLQQVHAAFGPKRMFWGSDLSRLPCTLKQGVTMFTENMPFFSAQDMEWIMGRGICEWIGWVNR
jgi:predicted TIM-barrel fold metal-dependent hydrolase